MKIFKFIILSLASLSLLTGCGREQSGTEAYLDEQDAIMDKMMEEMDNVEDTGSADLDFLKGMIPHHQSAVEMSESYLKHADKNGEFTELAENIIETQNQEIDQMNAMIKRLEKANGADDDMETDQEEAYLEKYDAMMDKHHSHAVSKTDDLDAAFAQGMSMHHQMAVDMAEIILKYTQDQELTDFANSIITLQKQEIREMQDYLNQNAGEGKHVH